MQTLIKSKHSDQLILTPFSFHRTSISSVQNSLSINLIIMEFPFESFSVHQIEFTLTLFIILVEVSFIFSPVFFDIRPVPIIKRCSQSGDFFIVQNTIPRKLIILPLPLICNLLTRIIQRTFSMHFILFPISNILASLTIEKSAKPMSFSIKFSSFIMTSCIFLTNLN